MSRLEKDSELVSAVLLADGLSINFIKANRQAIQVEANNVNSFQIYDDTYILVGGSRADGVGMYYGYGRTDKSSDLDLVAVYKHKVVEEGADTCGAMIVKETDMTSPGYVRLNLIVNNNFVTYCNHVNEKLYLSSTKWMKYIESEPFRAMMPLPFKVHGPALDLSLSNSAVATALKKSESREFRYTDPAFNVKSSTGTDDTDVLLCFESKAWPCEANEWLTRKRPSGWPGKMLIQSVSRTGCILAPVNNKDSPNNDLQWRICSNKGELMLTETFNVTQFHCYFLLKMFNTEVLKQASGKNLTSYIMKTLMLWMSEEIPANEWRPELLLSCFIKCLNRLKGWIDDRFLPNYFVVGRNMFIKTDFTVDLAKRTIHEIEQICADPIRAIQETELLKLKFKEPTDELRKLYMEIQNWIICRRSMAENFYFIGNNVISSAHSFTDTEKSLENCEKALGELLRLGGYYEHMSDLLRNSIGVLHYALAVKSYSGRGSTSSNEDFRDLMPDDEVWKILNEEGNVLREMRPDDIHAANEIFENIKMRDLSHSPLRKATCLLLDKQYERALELILETAMNMQEKCTCKVPGDVHYRTVSDELLNIACDSVMKLKVANNISMMKKLKRIMERDIETENLEETMQALDQEFPADIYVAFAGWWDVAIFHVTFSSAEIKVLSKALQNEAAMKAAVPYTVPALGSSFPAHPFRKSFHLTLHPQVYLWYLHFLVNYGKTHSPYQNGLDEVRANFKKSILSMCILRNVLERGTYLARGEVRPCGMSKDHYSSDSLVDDIQLPTSTDDLIVGYNLLVSIYVQLGYYKDAAKYLLESMRLSWECMASGGNPASLFKNVAYYYFKIIIRALLEMDV